MSQIIPNISNQSKCLKLVQTGPNLSNYTKCLKLVQNAKTGPKVSNLLKCLKLVQMSWTVPKSETFGQVLVINVSFLQVVPGEQTNYTTNVKKFHEGHRTNLLAGETAQRRNTER